MSMVNVSLVGNLVKAPEQVCFASGRIKTTLIVAVNYPKSVSGNNERPTDGADFYRIETWGKLAELAQKYLSKGNQVGISGRLFMEHWTDKEGRDRLTPVVTAAQLSLPPRPVSSYKDHELENDKKITAYPEDDLPAQAVPITAIKEPALVYSSKKRKY